MLWKHCLVLINHRCRHRQGHLVIYEIFVWLFYLAIELIVPLPLNITILIHRDVLRLGDTFFNTPSKKLMHLLAIILLLLLINYFIIRCIRGLESWSSITTTSQTCVDFRLSFLVPSGCSSWYRCRILLLLGVLQLRVRHCWCVWTWCSRRSSCVIILL